MDDWTRHSVLVTGGSGFIGSALVEALLAKGSLVSCLLRSTSRKSGTDFQRITGDVTSSVDVTRAIQVSKPDIVFHLAGCVKTHSRDQFMAVNADGVEHVVSACAACSSPPVLVLVSSLAAVGPSCTDQPHVESDTPVPVSDYGRSKLAGENVAFKYAAQVPITIVRPPIVFGPGDRALLEMFKPIWRLGLHVVPGTTEYTFSLIHVEDLVHGLIDATILGQRISTQNSQGQGIYFLADDHHLTMTQLGLAIAEALGKKSPRIVHLPTPLVRLAGTMGQLKADLTGKLGWVNRDKIHEALAGSWTCSSAKAHQELNWSVSMSLTERLRQTADWYRHEKWL